MNRRRIFFVTFLLALAILSSCNNEDEDKTEITLDYFVDVEALDNVQVNIIHGSDYGVRIKGGDASDVNLSVEDLKLTVRDGNDVEVEIIHPALRKVKVRNNAKVRFDTDFESLVPEFSIEGFDAAEITSRYAIHVNTIEIELDNASKLAFDNLNTDHLELDLADGTRCNIQGVAKVQEIEMKDGCRFNLDYPDQEWNIESPVMGDSIWVSVDNGANAWVYAEQYLNAEGDTGSRVFYKGEPSNIESDMKNGAEIYAKEN